MRNELPLGIRAVVCLERTPRLCGARQRAAAGDVPDAAVCCKKEENRLFDEFSELVSKLKKRLAGIRPPQQLRLQEIFFQRRQVHGAQ